MKRNLKLADKEYGKVYQKVSAQVKAKIVTKDEFRQWIIEAREFRDNCIAGKITLYEFTAWLHTSTVRSKV